VYCDHTIEQDHRGIKGRYRPMRGFGSVIGAARFCAAYEEVRDYFRCRTTLNEVVPLRVQREQFCVRFGALRALVRAA
jgi:transposase-like protein